MLSVKDIDQGLVQDYLMYTGSQLARPEHKGEPITIYQKMDLVGKISDEVVENQLVPVLAPRNVALLFFNRKPHTFFKGAMTEITIFSHDNCLREEKKVIGPIDQQIEKCLSLILEKPKDVAYHTFPDYPQRALREAVVNAFCHRSYEVSDPDPVKIFIRPESIEIISYPGPDPTLKPEHFSENKVPPVKHRNRRIADFLKSKKLAEGLYTGVDTIFKSMKENKNPKPEFDFSTSYFRVRLPGHPKYIVQSLRGRVDYLCAKGSEADAVKLIEEYLEKDSNRWSEHLITKLIEVLHVEDDEHDPKVSKYQKFLSERKQRRAVLKEQLAKWCESKPLNISSGVKLVTELVEEDAAFADISCVVPKVFDLCELKDDQGRPQLEALKDAHKIFEAMGEVALTDASVSFQFASCKFNLYVFSTQKDLDPEFKQRKASCREPKAGTRERRDLFPLLRRAEDFVRTAIQLSSKDDKPDKNYLAMEWRLLGYINSQRCAIGRSNEKQVTDCYDKARGYDPSIKLNSLYFPAGSRSRYAASSSQEGK